MGFVKGEPGTEARPPCSDRLYSTEGEPEQPGDLTGATQQRVLVRAVVHSGRAYMENRRQDRAIARSVAPGPSDALSRLPTSFDGLDPGFRTPTNPAQNLGLG